MQLSTSAPATGYKSKLRSPLFVGITWFICSFLVSEGCYRLQDFVESDYLNEALFQISEAAAFPAPYIYDQIANERLQKGFDLYRSEHPEGELTNINPDVMTLDTDQRWDLEDELRDMGYAVSVSEPEIYAIYIGSCALTGLILALVVFMMFGKSGAVDSD